MVPEGEGLFTGGFFSVDEGGQVDAVEEWLFFDGDIGEREKGGIDVG